MLVLFLKALLTQEYLLPPNVRATTNPVEAISGAQFALHAVPCQHSRSFLEKIKGHLPPSLPFICVSKGLELGTGETMAQILPSVLGKDQPACFLSGPSFAKEVMEQRPTGLVCASKVSPPAAAEPNVMSYCHPILRFPLLPAPFLSRPWWWDDGSMLRSLGACSEGPSMPVLVLDGLT